MRGHPRRNGDLTGATGPEGWAIYDPDTDTAHFVNESARAIWELCDGQTSIEEMASAVEELTGQPYSEALQNVLETIEILREADLVR